MHRRRVVKWAAQQGPQVVSGPGKQARVNPAGAVHPHPVAGAAEIIAAPAYKPKPAARAVFSRGNLLPCDKLDFFIFLKGRALFYNGKSVCLSQGQYIG